MEQRGASHNARNRLPHPASQTVHELVQACKELDDNEMNRQARPRSPVLTPAEAGRETAGRSRGNAQRRRSRHDCHD